MCQVTSTGRAKEGQPFGRTTSLVLVGLQSRMAFGLPRDPMLRDRLIWPGFILRSVAGSLLVGLLNQSFFPASARHRSSPCRSCAPAVHSRCAPGYACADSSSPPRAAPGEWFREPREAAPPGAALSAQQQRPRRRLILFSIGLPRHFGHDARPLLARVRRLATSSCDDRQGC
jgi:hypothetical protein